MKTQTKTKHTPGPWKVGWNDRGLGHGDFGVILGDGTVIELHNIKNQKANAQLIATSYGSF